MSQELQMRRRSGYAALPGNEGDHPGSSSGQHAGSAGLFNSLYSALGGWLIEPSAEQNGLDSTALEAPQSLSQVIEQMGNWALRGVMFNMCMPVTAGSSARHTPLASRSDTPEEEAAAAAAAMKAGAAASSSSVRSSTAGRCSNSSVLDAAGGCAGSDVAKRLGQQELGKQQAAGPAAKPLSHSNSSANLTDQQQLDALTPTAAAANANLNSDGRDTSGGSSTEAGAAAAAAAVLQQEVGRLRQEVSCLRTTLGTLYVTCSHLKEENARLRSAEAGGEELLSGALQQLLGQKNELQQEVARLRSQNTALQELLDYTAAAAAGPAASAAADSAPWGCCDSSNAQGNADEQYAAEYAAASFLTAQRSSCNGSPAVYAAAQACSNNSSAAGGAVEGSLWDLQQDAAEQQDRGYWLVTPAASPGASSVCASSHRSPVAASSGKGAAWRGTHPAAVCEVESSFHAASSSSDVPQLQLPSVATTTNAADVAGVAAPVLQQDGIACNKECAAAMLQPSSETIIAAVATAEEASEIEVAAGAAAVAAGQEIGDLLGADLCQGDWGDAGDGVSAAARGLLGVGAAVSTPPTHSDQPSLC